MGSPWTDEEKQEVIDKYVEAEPTPENTIELVKELAHEYDKTPNGVMQVLAKAKVYVKKTPAANSSASSGKVNSAAGTTRVSKADSIAKLKKAIESTGNTADVEILSRLTGKAAIYFATLIDTLTADEGAFRIDFNLVDNLTTGEDTPRIDLNGENSD